MKNIVMTEPIRVSPSQLNVWLSCPQAWHYGYVEKIKPKGTKVYFNVGSYAHEIMHVYFHLLQAGYEHGSEFIRNSMLTRLRSDFEKLVSDGQIPSSEALIVMKKVSTIFFKYVDYQSSIIDSGIEVENVEHSIEVEHTLPSGRTVLLNGIVDLLYRKASKRRVRDHKSGENSGYYSQEKTKALQQLWFYVIIYHHLGIPIDLMEISFLSTYDYKPKKGETVANPTLDQLFKFYPVEINPEMIKVMSSWLDQTLDAMLSSSIYRNIHPGCTLCGFWSICKTEMRGISSRGVILGNYERKPENAKISDKHSTGSTDSFTLDNITFS